MSIKSNLQKWSDKDKIKAVEVTSGTKKHGESFYPTVEAIVHYDSGAKDIERVEGNSARGNPIAARHSADRAVHRMKDSAKSLGVPVITHTSGTDARHRDQPTVTAWDIAKAKSIYKQEVEERQEAYNDWLTGWGCVSFAVIFAVLFMVFVSVMWGWGFCIDAGNGMQFCV